MKRPAAAVALVLLLAACSDGGATTATSAGSEAAEAPAEGGVTVVATTSILGDIASTVVGEDGSVEVLLPIGADPHAFSPSAQQATALREADLVVANGLDLEEGLISALESAEEDGVTVFHATDHVDLIDYVEVEGAHSEDEHADEEHSEEHSEDDEHADEAHGEDEDGHGDEDPHVWFDPARMADVAGALGEELTAIDPDAGFADRAAALADDLEALDDEIEAMLADIPEDERVLVTNHEVLGYFADAYGFDVVGTIIPGGTTLAEPSAADLEDIIEVVTETGTRAIIAESTNPSRLAEVVAEEVGADVQVVELFTESLSDPDGEAGTYIDMMRVNATRIAEALTA